MNIYFCDLGLIKDFLTMITKKEQRKKQTNLTLENTKENKLTQNTKSNLKNY